MSRRKRPTFTVHFRDLFGLLPPMRWNYCKNGMPTSASLRREVERFFRTLTQRDWLTCQLRSVMIVGAVVVNDKNRPCAVWKGALAHLHDVRHYEQPLEISPDPKHLVDAGLISFEERFMPPRTCWDAILPFDMLDPSVDSEGTPFVSKGIRAHGLAWRPDELCTLVESPSFEMGDAWVECL